MSLKNKLISDFPQSYNTKQLFTPPHIKINLPPVKFLQDNLKLFQGDGIYGNLRIVDLENNEGKLKHKQKMIFHIKPLTLRIKELNFHK